MSERKNIVISASKLFENLGLTHLIAKYDLLQGEIVGFTSTYVQNVACFALANKLKEKKPEIITVMGGGNCEAPMGQEIVNNVNQIDFVFSGPALKSFPQFLRYYANGEEDKCHKIPGVLSKKNGSEPHSRGAFGETEVFDQDRSVGMTGEDYDIDLLLDIDYSPFLDMHEKFFTDKDRSSRLMLLIETSRGCSWGVHSPCMFCSANTQAMEYRYMSPENALRQFQTLFKYSNRFGILQAVDTLVPKRYLKEVFPFLKTPPGITIIYEVRADLSAEDLQLLSVVGIKKIQIGIESLSTSTLKLMKKGTTAFQNILMLMNCVRYAVLPTWNLLLGSPGEGEEVYKSYLDIIPLLTHLPSPFVNRIRFDRYSQYFYNQKEYCLDLRPYDSYSMIYPFEEHVLQNLAYFWLYPNLSKTKL